MSRSNSRLRTVVTVVIALFVVAAMVAPAALAHAQLLSSDPEDGASLPTTDRVVLTFNEEVNPDFVQVVLAGPDGGALSLDDPVVEGTVLTQPVTPTTSGEHSLTYRVVSADGHPISGRIAFTLTDVPGSPGDGSGGGSSAEAPTTPQQATAMSTAGAGPAAAAGDTGATDGSGSGSSLTWLVVAAVLAALAAGGAWLARSRRHPQH